MEESGRPARPAPCSRPLLPRTHLKLVRLLSPPHLHPRRCRGLIRQSGLQWRSSGTIRRSKMRCWWEAKNNAKCKFLECVSDFVFLPCGLVTVDTITTSTHRPRVVHRIYNETHVLIAVSLFRTVGHREVVKYPRTLGCLNALRIYPTSVAAPPYCVQT